MVESDNSRFKVTARRGEPRPGLRVRALREIDPAELPRLREANIAETQRALLAAAQTLPFGLTQPLDLLPHLQQSDNTCLLAAAISVAEGIQRKAGRQVSYDEQTLSTLARTQGLLARGGMATERQETRAQVEAFLSDHLGLSMRHIDSADPVVMAQTSAIAAGNVLLLNTAAHWRALYGLERQTPVDLSWSVIDPLLANPQIFTNRVFAERLVGSILTGQAAVAGELFVVEVPKLRFRVLHMRTS